MMVGAAYGPRQQHCLCCLSEIIEETGIVARVSQTGRSGVRRSKEAVFRARDLSLCRRPLPQTPRVAQTRPSPWLGFSVRLICVDREHGASTNTSQEEMFQIVNFFKKIRFLATSKLRGDALHEVGNKTQAFMRDADSSQQF